MIIPCIDIMGGKVVQLIQGEKKMLELNSYEELVNKFRGFEIQVIDLDAAKNEGSNLPLIKKICKKIPCRVGGGIRDIKKSKELIAAGAKKVIIGTRAFKEGIVNKNFLEQMRNEIGIDRIIIAIDSKKGNIVTEGWREDTGISAFSVIKQLEPYCSEFLYTYVDKEGMMEGTNLSVFEKLRSLTTKELTAAGGITSLREIEKLERLRINSALGMALYMGKLKLEDLEKFKRA